jgi:hypothetical protein
LDSRSSDAVFELSLRFAKPWEQDKSLSPEQALEAKSVICADSENSGQFYVEPFPRPEGDTHVDEEGQVSRLVATTSPRPSRTSSVMTSARFGSTSRRRSSALPDLAAETALDEPVGVDAVAVELKAGVVEDKVHAAASRSFSRLVATTSPRPSRTSSVMTSARFGSTSRRSRDRSG